MKQTIAINAGDSITVSVGADPSTDSVVMEIEMREASPEDRPIVVRAILHMGVDECTALRSHLYDAERDLERGLATTKLAKA